MHIANLIVASLPMAILPIYLIFRYFLLYVKDCFTVIHQFLRMLRRGTDTVFDKHTVFLLAVQGLPMKYLLDTHILIIDTISFDIDSLLGLLHQDKQPKLY